MKANQQANTKELKIQMVTLENLTKQNSVGVGIAVASAAIGAVCLGVAIMCTEDWLRWKIVSLLHLLLHVFAEGGMLEGRQLQKVAKKKFPKDIKNAGSKTGDEKSLNRECMLQ